MKAAFRTLFFALACSAPAWTQESAGEAVTTAPSGGKPVSKYRDLEDGQFDISSYLATPKRFLPVPIVVTEPAVGYGFEGQADPPVQGPPDYAPNYKKDLIFHFAAGPQYDLHQNFGIYATGGLTAGVLRGIASSLELDVGLQGRLP